MGGAMRAPEMMTAAAAAAVMRVRREMRGVVMAQAVQSLRMLLLVALRLLLMWRLMAGATWNHTQQVRWRCGVQKQ